MCQCWLDGWLLSSIMCICLMYFSTNAQARFWGQPCRSACTLKKLGQHAWCIQRRLASPANFSHICNVADHLV